ncbi:helix-turn-helix domain-containing protein [Caloranaerobacter sp. DY30410]|uniref:helix-turn-helix domain-containing protein n=1 Tax=Caloranaerobacter sp. DY30410 TaxID=3238305 RepID=UPI003CFCAC3B
MPNIYVELGKKIRKYRKKKKLSTPELAKRLNISTGLVNNIENGRHDVFKLELLLKISKELNVSLGELLQSDYIDIRDLSIQEELKKILKDKNNRTNEKIDYINQKLNEIFILFLATMSKYDYNTKAIDYITNHILEELNFIKDLDVIENKVST